MATDSLDEGIGVRDVHSLARRIEELTGEVQRVCVVLDGFERCTESDVKAAAQWTIPQLSHLNILLPSTRLLFTFISTQFHHSHTLPLLDDPLCLAFPLYKRDELAQILTRDCGDHAGEPLRAQQRCNSRVSCDVETHLYEARQLVEGTKGVHDLRRLKRAWHRLESERDEGGPSPHSTVAHAFSRLKPRLQRTLDSLYLSEQEGGNLDTFTPSLAFTGV